MVCDVTHSYVGPWAQHAVCGVGPIRGHNKEALKGLWRLLIPNSIKGMLARRLAARTQKGSQSHGASGDNSAHTDQGEIHKKSPLGSRKTGLSNPQICCGFPKPRPYQGRLGNFGWRPEGAGVLEGTYTWSSREFSDFACGKFVRAPTHPPLEQYDGVEPNRTAIFDCCAMCGRPRLYI